MLYGIKNKDGEGRMSTTEMVIEKKELAPGIVVYKNVLRDASSLVADIEDSVSMGAVSWQSAYVISTEPGTSELNSDIRDTKIIGVPYFKNPQQNFSSPEEAFNSKIREAFFGPFTFIEGDYCAMFGVSIQSHDEYQILKYGAGQKFTNHVDDHYEYLRRISTVYYINDNYSGGEINFPRFNISYKPGANEMLVFPSTYVYNHSVSEVTDGTRYAVVSWAA